MILPEAGSKFGDKVRTRLEHEHVIWFGTVNSRGIPQPNPVWFTWDGSRILTYNLPNSARARNVARRPEVALHFNQRDGDGDIVVLTGIARVAAEVPAADLNEAYLAKYAPSLPGLGLDAAGFAATFSLAIAVEITKVRGE